MKDILKVQESNSDPYDLKQTIDSEREANAAKYELLEGMVVQGEVVPDLAVKLGRVFFDPMLLDGMKWNGSLKIINLEKGNSLSMFDKRIFLRGSEPHGGGLPPAGPVDMQWEWWLEERQSFYQELLSYLEILFGSVDGFEFVYPIGESPNRESGLWARMDGSYLQIGDCLAIIIPEEHLPIYFDLLEKRKLQYDVMD